MCDEKKFNVGGVVYHKATGEKGVLSKKLKKDKWEVAWDPKTKTINRESELYTEKEYAAKQKSISKVRFIPFKKPIKRKTF